VPGGAELVQLRKALASGAKIQQQATQETGSDGSTNRRTRNGWNDLVPDPWNDWNHWNHWNPRLVPVLLGSERSLSVERIEAGAGNLEQ